MDKSRSAQRRGDSAALSENTSDLLSDEASRATDGAVQSAHAAGARQRNGDGAGPDPDPTEEIFAATAPESRPPRIAETDKFVTPPAQGVSLKTLRLEPTHPVRMLQGGQPNADAAPVNDPFAGDPRLSPGTVLAGRYVILDSVVHSGMGQVYKALDRQRELAGAGEPWVALKVARPTRSARGDTAHNLRHEFLKLSGLRHPGIVAVYDLCSDRGTNFMVLEWLSGETLASLLSRINSKRVALRTAQQIVRTVASALAHAHGEGVVHGDVKPSNIFITEDNTVKLLDFGAFTQPSADGDNEQSWATRAYASCDVLQGKTPAPSDDVFALGVTAYRLFSGERPFGELDALAAREQELLPPDLPDDAFASWPAVRSALAFDAVDRPADAAEFLALLSEDGDEPAAAPFPRPVPAHLTAIAWGALAASILGLTVWWSIPDLAPTSQVGRLLDDAAEAVAAGRLVEPPQESAFAYFSAVLEKQPASSEALAGLDEIAEHYLTRARSALTAGNFEVAVGNLEVARRVRPSHFGIAAIEDLIARHRRDLLVSARQAAAFDVELADRYLARAAALSGEDDPALAGVREEIERQRAAGEVESLMRAVDERILSERLLVPAGDSAVDVLRRAMRVAPDNRQVQLAGDRVASALLFQAMFAISNGDLDNAQAFIDAAKSLQVRHLALSRAEYELAKARTEALTRRDDSR